MGRNSPLPLLDGGSTPESRRHSSIGFDLEKELKVAQGAGGSITVNQLCGNFSFDLVLKNYEGRVAKYAFKLVGTSRGLG